MSWKTSGHNHVKRILDLQLRSGSFPHAYLFLGPQGVGKKMLATELAGQLLEAKDPEKHADFVLFDCGDGVDIEAVRLFMEKLSWKPFVGKYKVVIIDNAQNLNIQSQNALLKTLEEPSSSTILILVSSQKLLPTILSRCQLLHFNRFSTKQMEEFCAERSIKFTPEQLSAAFGQPGKIKGVEVENEALAFWGEIKKSTRAERLAHMQSWAESDAEELGKILDSLVCAEVLGLSKEPKNYKAVSLLLEAKENLKRNFNKKMILQRLFLHI